MDQHIINRLRRLLRLKQLKKMSTEQVIIFAHSFAKKIGENIYLVLTTIGDLYKISSGYSREFECIYCDSFKDEIRRLLKVQGFRRPRWRYGSGGSYIFLTFQKQKVTIFQNLCYVDGKSFPLPNLAVRHLLKQSASR